MIPVQRSQTPPVLDLSDNDSKASKEKSKAAEKKNEDPNASGDFKVYKDNAVKRELGELFHNKCAYCESQYAGTQPVDIEHFRPKNAVKFENGETVPPALQGEFTDHPGYWWLAMKWENLLPSCIDCNRERRHVEAEGDTGLTKLGKKDKFPIDGPRAYHEHDSLDAENCLLIDPCEAGTDPGQHLQWRIDTELSIVEPTVHGGQDDPMGIESIKVYGLNRMGLVQRRTTVLNRMRALTRTIMALGRVLELISDQDVHQQVEDIMKDCMVQLRSYGHDKQEFSAMAKAFIKDFESALQ